MIFLKSSGVINYRTDIAIYILFKKDNIFITVYRVKYDYNNKNFLKVLYSSSCGSKVFKNTNKFCVNSVKLVFFKLIFFLIKNKFYVLDLVLDGRNYYSEKIMSYIFKMRFIDSSFRINCINRYYRFPYNGCRLKKYRFL